MGTRRKLLAGLGLAALILAVYWPVRHHAFINYDDPDYVTENLHVQAGLTGQGLAWAFFNLHGDATYWHPLTWVSHMLDCQLFGVNAGAHHLVNVALHTVNALLLLLLLNRMTGAFWRSAVVAALFALHPLQVDTVAWVTERKNVLSTCFWLLTMLAYVRYAGESKVRSPKSKVAGQEPGARSQESEGGRGRAEVRSPKSEVRSQASRITDRAGFWYVATLGLFALGLMCKPALVTLPCVLLLLDYWPLGRLQLKTKNLKLKTFSPLVIEKLPFLALAAVVSMVTVAAHHEIRAASVGMPLGWRAANALVSYVRYLGKAFWPGHLAVFYPHPGVWPVGVIGGSALFLLTVSALVLWQMRRRPYLFTGWFWFLGVLVPMIGIIQAGAQAMADRFAYVPLIGLFIGLVWGAVEWAGHWPRRLVTLKVVAVAVLGGCVLASSRQLSYWENSFTLFQHALEVTSGNYCAHFSLGNELADRGQVQEALQHWEAALQIEPRDAQVHGRIGSALCQQGDYAGAVGHYRLALGIDPDLANALNNLAWLLATCPEASVRNGPEAVRLAEKACELTHHDRTIMVGTLAAAYAEAGRFPDAIAAAERACALADRNGEQALLEKNRQLLELYRAGKAYREAPATDANQKGERK